MYLHFMISTASDFDLDIRSSLHDEGRRDFSCLTNKWLHCTCSGPAFVEPVFSDAGFVGMDHWLSLVNKFK